MRFRSVVVALSALAMLSTAAWAQDAAEATADAAQVPPERDADTAEVGLVGKARRWVEEKKLAERLAPREGVYLRFGGMTTGSGLALGAGYRRYFGAREDLFADVSAAFSTRTYKAADAEIRWARVWSDRVELWSDFRYRDYPQEDFFGLGPTSSNGTRTNYAIESTDVVGRALVNVRPWLRVGADIGYFDPKIGRGTDDRMPSTEQIFNDTQAPGIVDQPDFLHQTLFAEVDYRDHRGNATRGGFYRVSFGTWEDVTLERFDHHRFDAEAAQFFPVTPTQTIAVRTGLSYVNNETGDRVPFYFLPYVGGADTIRGYREFRFRDENILFVNLEYRLRLARFFHIAPFFDAGEVRADWEQIGPRGLRTSYGLGLRAGTAERVFMRIDLGRSQEGTRLFFKFGPSF